MVKDKVSSPPLRVLRVGEQVRTALMQIILRDEIQDNLIKKATVLISEVHMSADLKIATAYVSPSEGTGHDVVILALNRNSRFIRGRISYSLKQMKYMPELRFRSDISFQNYWRIDALLRSPEVARDLMKSNDDLQE